MISPLTEVLRISALVRPERIPPPVGPECISPPGRPERSEGADAPVTRAAELAASIRSMTPAIVAYRGMTQALPRLLTELDTFK